MHVIIIALVLCSAYAYEDTQYGNVRSSVKEYGNVISSVKGGHTGGYNNYNPANYPRFREKLCSAYAYEDTQYGNVRSSVKEYGNVISSVKGGHTGGYNNYNPANYPSYDGYRSHQNATQPGYYGSYNASQHGYYTQNTSKRVDFEVGVCYVEVPTASLVRNPSHIPAGNGSRPDLSRIRTCCKGYIRNMHNFKICDPVCSQDCINGLCSAPDTCTCFPDHVRNLAGFCVPTCPIGCQNGHCSGGECLCKEGYKLDRDSKFCIPHCRENCGGLGNCTDSNVCHCKNGYQSTPNGNCRPVCDRCNYGDCVAPNDCRCKPGYNQNSQGHCEPHCPQGCGQNGRCIAPNVCDNPTPTRPHTYPVSPSYSPYGDRTHGNQNQGQNKYGQETTTNPTYPGNQVYPGNQGYPGNNAYPGQQGYQGNQNYPNNQVNPTNQANTGYQIYPGNPIYPGNQVNPGNPAFYPGQVTSQKPNSYGSQVNYTGYQNQYGSHDQNGYNRFQGQSGNHLYPDLQQSELLQCSQTCINGACEDGNRCRCNAGYIMDASDPTESRCLPYCPGGCPNGICSAPSFCICNAGYTKDTSVKGRSSCVRRNRRSIDTPTNIADFLIFDIPNDY